MYVACTRCVYGPDDRWPGAYIIGESVSCAHSVRCVHWTVQLDPLQIIKSGQDGHQPQRGNLCKINLTGKLEDGTVVEDLHNHTVQVGDVEVVQGVDMAIPLMMVGELAEISVEPRFAYGSNGLINEDDNQKTIPPNAKVCCGQYRTKSLANSIRSANETRSCEPNNIHLLRIINICFIDYLYVGVAELRRRRRSRECPICF